MHGNTRFHSAAVHASAVLVVVLGLLLPLSARADANADSKGSDWWGDDSGWVWNWPGVARAPGGTVKGEYQHWFEGAPPAAWSGFGPAIWTLPATAAGFPYWPGTLTGDTGGNGAYTSDGHGCYATSDWQWEAYRNNLFPNEIVFRKGTAAYANAKSIKYVATAAHSRTRLVDPIDFENPLVGSDWSVLGRIAPFGTLSVSEDDSIMDESASAFFDMNYALSVDGGSFLDILDLHVGADGKSKDVTLTYAPGLHFFRSGIEISASQIISELNGFYLPDNSWALNTPQGEALDEGYYFDVAYNLSGSTSSASLVSTRVSGADDAKVNFAPEPSSLALLLLSLGGVWLSAGLSKPRQRSRL